MLHRIFPTRSFTLAKWFKSRNSHNVKANKENVHISHLLTKIPYNLKSLEHCSFLIQALSENTGVKMLLEISGVHKLFKISRAQVPSEITRTQSLSEEKLEHYLQSLENSLNLLSTDTVQSLENSYCQVTVTWKQCRRVTVWNHRTTAIVWKHCSKRSLLSEIT